MDCGEAREKLNQLARNLLETQEDSALRDHLSRCPACARLAKAEKLLTEDLEQMQAIRPPQLVTIERVRREIAIREKRYQNTNLGVRVMQQVRDMVIMRPRLSLAAAAVVVLVAASVLVPVRPDHPMSYEIAFAAPAGGFVLNQHNAEQMLAALSIPEARIETIDADSGVVYTISELKDSLQVRRLRAVLDSMGGRQVVVVPKRDAAEARTIWHLVLNKLEEEKGSSPAHSRSDNRTVTLNLKKMLGDEFVLWMPAGERTDDSLHGLLMQKKGKNTNIQLVGMPMESMVTDCGLSQYLNGNTVMHTTMPNGERVTSDLTKIEDVRKLEEAGYNFVLMEFDKPGQIPIPGMGPKLNEISPNPFTDKAVIEYMIPRAYEVRIQILNEHGELVRSLLDCIAIAGIRHLVWDGLDDNEEPVPPGTYVCRFVAGEYSETKEITIER